MRAPGPRVEVENPSDGGFLYWLLKLYLFSAIAALLAAAAAAPALFLWIARGLPPTPDLARYDAEAALPSRILASDGRTLAVIAEQRREIARPGEVPEKLVRAFLAAEDRTFFSHRGIDVKGVLRAALANLRAGQVRQGGSTITQQVAKIFLSPERTIQRKARELVLALRLEARFTKRQILHVYLNHIYLGGGAYGVKAAARAYFDKGLGDLDLDEAALLAGLARAPSRYDPRRHPTRARRRRDQVLRAMVAAGFASEAEAKRAMARPIRLRRRRAVDEGVWVAPYVTAQARRVLGRWFGERRVATGGFTVSTTADLAVQAIARRQVWASVSALDKRQGYRGPVARLRTPARRRDVLARIAAIYDTRTLDPARAYLAVVDRVASRRAWARLGPRRVVIPLELARWAAPYSRTNAENNHTIDALTKVLAPGDLVWVAAPPRWRRGPSWGRPEEAETTVALEQVPRVEGAIYAFDHQSGYVVAMVGGLDYDRSKFDRTVQACRQPGSTYKPIYYSLALDSPRFSMATILKDRPYVPEPGETWTPQNVHGTLDGRVTLHMALVRSLNLPSIDLLTRLGADAVARWARRLGFTTPIHADKALALGASCVRMDELTRAFAIFARGGTAIDPVYVRQVRDRRGVVLADHTTEEDPLLDEGDRLDRIWARSRTRPRRVIDPRTAFLTTKLLRDSVLMGIAARARIVPAPTAGKGGTSSDTSDTWFVGFTSRWAVTAWMGDDTYRRPLGAKEASYTTAIPMWANFMKRVVDGRPLRELPVRRPRGLRQAVMDFQHGGPPAPGGKSVTIFYRPGSYRPNRPAPPAAP